MPTLSGFASTPTSRLLILSYIVTSTVTSLLSLKHYLPIRPTPHLWPYLQVSRPLTYQLASTASTDLLFTVVLLYHFRVLERLWGTRKYTSFLIVAFLAGGASTVLMGILLRICTLGAWNYIPAGLTSVVFAALAAWGNEVPRCWRYKILNPVPQIRSGTASDLTRDPQGLTLSDKSTTYLLAVQLALSQFPYNLLPAGMGWVVGQAWVGDALPAWMGRWRVGAWVVGESKGKRDTERERYEGLRRRMEEEDAGRDDGMRTNTSETENTNTNTGSSTTGEERRRGVGGQVVDYFRGVF